MDIIFLRGLHIDTLIGIYDWEREIRQTVVIDLEMGTDIRRAAESDVIEDALDYSAVHDRTVSFVTTSRYFLVEALAEHLAAMLLNEFQIVWLRLTLNKKGAIKGASDVGLTIERSIQPNHG